MNFYVTIVFIIILVVLIIFVMIQDKESYKKLKQIRSSVEGFNNQAGRFCLKCRGKTFNQCVGCFNCGFCVDKYGRGQCIGGDHKGPFNFERCARWYSGDPYTFMMQKNANYGCKDGPRSSNRIIGV